MFKSFFTKILFHIAIQMHFTANKINRGETASKQDIGKSL